MFAPFVCQNDRSGLCVRCLPVRAEHVVPAAFFRGQTVGMGMLACHKRAGLSPMQHWVSTQVWTQMKASSSGRSCTTPPYRYC